MMRNCRLALLGAALVLCDAQTSVGHPAGICEAEVGRASREEDIPLGVLYAVGLTETGRRGALQPYALNIEGKSLFPQSERAALVEFYKARSKGARLIDLGCMQINYHYHGQEFASVASMLNPALNVNYAARFLKLLRKREGSWTMAVARYHAGPNNNPAQRRYICAVIRNLVATGFGKWTVQARKFCS
jgi:Transglycosylase SLT domain